MTIRLVRLGLLTVVLIALAAPGTAHAQAGDRQRGTDRYAASLLGGIGGTVDADFTHPTFQLGWSLATQRDTFFTARLGRIGFGSRDLVGDLSGADLTFVTLAGEYRFQESFYSSGMFLGVGYYGINGDNLVGGENSDNGVGLTFGINGEFDINRRWSVLVELSGHWANLAPETFYANALVGFGIHF